MNGEARVPIWKAHLSLPAESSRCSGLLDNMWILELSDVHNQKSKTFWNCFSGGSCSTANTAERIWEKYPLFGLTSRMGSALLSILALLALRSSAQSNSGRTMWKHFTIKHKYLSVGGWDFYVFCNIAFNFIFVWHTMKIIHNMYYVMYYVMKILPRYENFDRFKNMSGYEICQDIKILSRCYGCGRIKKLYFRRLIEHY